jgi:6-phosphogluconolactonase
MRLFRLALATTVAVVAASSSLAAAANVLLFAGTYTRNEGWVNGQGKGIHVFQFNTDDGSLRAIGAQAFGPNPSFVTGTHNANRRMIYSVSEVADPSQLKPGSKTGFVYALKVDAAGKLTQLNRVESGSRGPAHVAVSPDEKFVTVANYDGGSISIYPVNADGSLAPATDSRAYQPGKRDVCHMHSMWWVGPGSNGVLAVDLGNDRIAQFTVNPTTGKLVNNPQNEFINRPYGSGPRHMAIHPTQKYAYVVDELKNTIGVYALTASTGGLSVNATQLISTLPAGFTATSTSADIHTSEDGNFLYSSNRGHDSIAMFKIGANGQLTSIGFESTRGKRPRSFHIYKDFMLVANQDTNDIQVFRIDKTTGKLVYTNQSASCGTPVSLFIPRY